MAAFDDLTVKEAGELIFIVGGAQALDAEVFMLLRRLGVPAALHTLDGKGSLAGVPHDDAFWTHLAMSDYFQLSGNTIRLLPRAYAYARYCDRRNWGRF